MKLLIISISIAIGILCLLGFTGKAHAQSGTTGVELGDYYAFLCDGSHKYYRATLGGDYKTVTNGESRGEVFSVPYDMVVQRVKFGAFKTATDDTASYTYQIWNVNQTTQIPTTMIWESSGIRHNSFFTQPLAVDVEVEGNPHAWHSEIVPNVQLEADTKYALVLHTNSIDPPIVIPRMSRIFDQNNLDDFADDGTACAHFAVYFDGSDWFVDFLYDSGIAIYGIKQQNDSTVTAAKQTLVQLKLGDDLGYSIVTMVLLLTTVVVGVIYHWPPIGIAVVTFLEVLGLVAITVVESVMLLTMIAVAGIAVTAYLATRSGGGAVED